MPSAPKVFRPSHQQRSCADAKVEQAREWQRQDARRGSASSRGYDRKWQAFRSAFLAEWPLCKACLDAGQLTPATIVDHVIPHQGNRELFWRPGNHQSLCKPCHDRKTITEDSGLAGGVNWHPPFLQPSRMPLTIVCGAPLSGKSRYVADRRAADDVVIDLDEIGSAMCGTDLHDWPRARIRDVGRERNRRLLMLSDASKAQVSAAWFIVSEPDAQWRQWWHHALRPVSIVVLETPRHVCSQRAHRERRNAGDLDVVIEGWWRTYTRRLGDEVVSPAP
jgi:5-methylcytosine-specific restriction protein A